MFRALAPILSKLCESPPGQGHPLEPNVEQRHTALHKVGPAVAWDGAQYNERIQVQLAPSCNVGGLYSGKGDVAVRPAIAHHDHNAFAIIHLQARTRNPLMELGQLKPMRFDPVCP